MELFLIQETFSVRYYGQRTVTAIVGKLPEKLDKTMRATEPFRTRGSLLHHPLLVKGTIVDGSHPDYDIVVLAHRLGAKEGNRKDV